MFVLLSLLVISTSTPFASAANNSTAITVGWVSDPSGRGTFSLVFSCLLTLGLCVWSAMHLNIPPCDETLGQTWMRNLKWGLLGIVAPELVVFAAWRQYNSARALNAAVNKQVQLADKAGITPKGKSLEEKLESAEPRYPWTMVHSFYAGMGGFIIKLDNSSVQGSLPFTERHYLTVSARGIELLAKCGHLPNIEEDDISDKSKADGLAKFLVCLQAGWMLVQVISRVILGLPVTLLEVNILGHVLCALIIYILWWHKPRLIHESTRLTGDWIVPLSAYMLMSSQLSGWGSTTSGILRRTWIEPEISSLALFTAASRNQLSNNSSKNALINTSDISATSQDSILSPSQSRNSIHSAYFGPRPRSSTPIDGFMFANTSEQAHSPSSMTHNRWRLAADAVDTYPSIMERFTENHDIHARNDTLQWLEPIAEELVTRAATNWPAEDLLRGTRGLVMGMVLWFASMAYGAVHIAAWNDYFPSEVETWMWRSSSVFITASGFLWLVINLLAHESKTIDTYWDNVLALKAHWISYLILGTLCSICGIAYVFARTFLVVEAFISIRQLPAAAYTTPDWTQIIPHL